MSFTINFPESEFQNASDQPLSDAARKNAEYLAATVLQPLRRYMGVPVFVTAFYQQKGHSISSVHKLGQAVDISFANNDRASLTKAFEWLAVNKPDNFGKLIDERDHLHITVPGAQNAYGEVWREPVEGEYVLAVVGHSLTSPVTWLVIALLVYLGIRWLA